MSSGLAIYVLVLFSTLVHNVFSSQSNSSFSSKMVVMLNDDDHLPFSYTRTVPAFQLALERVSRTYPHIEFAMTFKNISKSCSPGLAAVFAAEEFYLNSMDVIFGPGCSNALNAVSRMSGYWNVPLFTAAGFDAMFADKNLYSTLTRLAFSLDRVSDFMLSVLQEFAWHHASLIVDVASILDMDFAASLERVFHLEDIQSRRNHSIRLSRVELNSSRAANNFTSLLHEAKSTSRGKA